MQISIVHYAGVFRGGSVKTKMHLNDILVDQVRSIRSLTKHPYSLNIIDNQMHPEARRDLENKLPDMEILETEGIHHTFPVGANKAIDTLSKDYLFLSHTDMLMSHNWLTALAQDLENTEKRYSVPASVSPILLFYPRLQTSPDKDLMLKTLRTQRLMEPDKVKNYMNIHGVPHSPWEGQELAVSNPGIITDNGWRLGGAYMTSKKFLDEVGHYDPMMNRMNDKSYGIKALMTRCKVMTSNGVYLHHIGGLHKTSGCYAGEGYYEDGIHKAYGSETLGAYYQFKKKWGFTVFNKVQDGSIWRELHAAQEKGAGKALIDKYRKMG